MDKNSKSEKSENKIEFGKPKNETTLPKMRLYGPSGKNLQHFLKQLKSLN